MCNYKSQRGVIKDNALKALVHDPLFRQRIEVNKKGKGSYNRKDKNYKRDAEAGNKRILWVFLLPAFVCFSSPHKIISEQISINTLWG